MQPQPSKRLQGLLKEFLSKQGLTAQFNLNMKKHGKPQIKSVEELSEWIIYNKFGWNKAIFLAFCWTNTEENKKITGYWYAVALSWKAFLRTKINQR